MSDGDAWHALRRFTAARIGLGRSGDSLPTAAVLEFSLAHARARDAVHAPFPSAQLADSLADTGLARLQVASAAPDRATYLRRPDLGRQLAPTARTALADAFMQTARAGQGRPAASAAAQPGPVANDLVLVLADGLSAPAVLAHGPPLVRALLGLLPGWRIGPLVIASQARVALGDEVGALLAAELVLVLIGERPGLSSPDSLGAYLTWQPRAGRSDAERNCDSNIRPEGQPVEAAAARIAWLLAAARGRRLTGVQLKDESDSMLLAGQSVRAMDGAAVPAPADADASPRQPSGRDDDTRAT